MDFYSRVALVCQNIPHGRVATYGQIALLCGKPGNARQVGYALNRRVTGRQIPAHRVVNARGFLSGFAAFDTRETQRLLLEAEGVLVSEDQRVDLKQFGWRQTMSEALWFRQCFEEENI